MGKADVVIEGTYSLPVITHVCLEPHGLTARWEGPDKLTVWASTQAVQVVAGELADALGIPVANVTVLTDYMGGGFGSKFGADVWGDPRRKAGQEGGPAAKLFLDRVQEHLAAGNRPSASGKIKLGASKDGKLVAMIAETHGTGRAAPAAARISPFLMSMKFPPPREPIMRSSSTAAKPGPCHAGARPPPRASP